MMKSIVAAFSFLACALPCAAQNVGPVYQTNTVPSGPCGQNIAYLVSPAGDVYTCKSGTWAKASTGGTVTSVTLAGSANQIAAAGTCSGATTINCTLSLPSNLILPNGTTATTQTQNDNSTKPATTAYTDLAVANAVAGINPAVAVLAASTANIVGTYNNGVSGVGATFTVTATGAFSLDGVSINTIGQRVLLKNQTTGFQNGIYTATVVGALAVSPVFTRALDYDQPSDINSTGAIPVQSGTVNTTTSWLLTSTVNTVGTDALVYAQFSLSPSTIQAANASYVTTSFSSTPTFTANSNTVTGFLITLTGNVTSSTLASAFTGQTLNFSVCQDATGGRSFVWPTNFVGVPTISSTVNSTASTCLNQGFEFDGTNANAVGAAYITGGTPGIIIPTSAGAVVVGAPSSATGSLSLPISIGSGQQLGAGPGVSAYQNANWTSTGGATTTVPLDTNLWDTSGGALHSTSSNTSRFTANSTGKWQLCGSITANSVASNPGAFVSGNIYVNGSFNVQMGFTTPFNNSGSYIFVLNGCALLSLNSGDYAEIAYYMPNSVTMIGGVGATYVMFWRVF